MEHIPKCQIHGDGPSCSLAAADGVLVGGQKGQTSLHKAASSNQCKVAEILVAAGADLNAEEIVAVRTSCSLVAVDSVLVGGQDGQPLCTGPNWAPYRKHQDMVKLLEAAGAR